MVRQRLTHFNSAQNLNESIYTASKIDDTSKVEGPSESCPLLFSWTVHFHPNRLLQFDPKYTLCICNWHMYKSPPCLLDDIIGKDQSEFSFE